MDEYLPWVALALLILLIGFALLRRRRGPRVRRLAASTSASSLLSAERPSLFDTVFARHVRPSGLDERLDAADLEAQRQEAEAQARLEGDREAAAWEARLAAELLAQQAPPNAEGIPALDVLEIEPQEGLSLVPLDAPVADSHAPTEAAPQPPADVHRPAPPTAAVASAAIASVPQPDLAALEFEPPAPTPLVPAQPAVVMVVEASKVVRLMTSRLLEQHGYRVVQFADGSEALQQIGQALPQALITGAELTGIDGFELTRRLRAAAGSTPLPIVMLSAEAGALRERAAQAGASAILGKPYLEAELLGWLQATRPAPGLH